MRYLVLFLTLLTASARADFAWFAGTNQLQTLAEGSTTTASNTSEQTLIELTNLPRNTLFQSVQLDLTAASTLTAFQIKVYRKRGAGAYVLLGTGSNLTGILTWTLASSSKGMESLTFSVSANAGDSFKVTGTQTILSAAFAIPYTVMVSQ